MRIETKFYRDFPFDLAAATRLRAAMIRRFPYVILYRFDGVTLYFAGLFHAASDPERWSLRDEEPGTH